MWHILALVRSWGWVALIAKRRTLRAEALVVGAADYESQEFAMKGFGNRVTT